MDSPETPNTRFRAQLTGSRYAVSDETRVMAYQPLRLESAPLQGIEAEEVSDIDLVAYLAIKYDAEIKKSESYQMEMFEQRDVSSKLQETYRKSVSEVGELSGYVKQLQNVSDQRIMAIVHESEENIALQQRLAEITDNARQVAMNESQQIVLRDQEANAAVTEARMHASGVMAEMREGFNEARIEFGRQNLMLRHYESCEVSLQLVQQEV